MSRFALALILTCATLPVSAQQIPVPRGAVGALADTHPTREVHPILSDTFQAWADELTGHPVTSGNRFELLETGAVSFPRKLALIRSAKRSVLFTTMLAIEDSTGKELRRALVAAAKRGCDVRCILDGNLADPRFTLRLRLGGVKVERFNKIFRFKRGKRLHIKTLVIDGETAVLGGMNVSDSYNLGDGTNSYFKDTDLAVTGDTVLSVVEHFEALWGDLRPEERAGSALTVRPDAVQSPQSDPRGLARFIVQESDRGERTIRDYYLRCFKAARERITWHVNNLEPQGPIVDGLRAAAARGVEVTCITNSARATSGLYGDFIGKVWFRYYRGSRERLVAAGVKLWLLDVPVHSKALVIDGVMASVGSYNVGSIKSDANMESTFVVYDPDLVAQVDAMLSRDLARATPMAAKK